MMVEIMKAIVFLMIAVPFAYIFLEVVHDIVKRTYGFLQREAIPVLIKARSRNDRS